MDQKERSLPRRYPAFGEVPSAVEGSPELRLELEGTAASLAGFVCSPNGLSATLRTAVRVPEDGGISYAFAERQQVNDAVDIWAIAPGSGTEYADKLHAQLLGGGGGVEGTLHAALFQLWFPVEVAALTDELIIEMAWPTLDSTIRLSIAAVSLREAASRADMRFVAN